MSLIANRFRQTHFGSQNGGDLQRSYKPYLADGKPLICNEKMQLYYGVGVVALDPNYFDMIK